MSNTLKLAVNRDELSWGALMDLEDATKTSEIARWLVEHAGADMAELRALPVDEIQKISEQVGAELRGALTVPKTSGRR